MSLDPLEMLLDAARFIEDDKPNWAREAREAVARARRSQPQRVPTAAIENLTRNQVQCDMDGVMIQVSRQALCEVLDYLSVARPDGGDAG